MHHWKLKSSPRDSTVHKPVSYLIVTECSIVMSLPHIPYYSPMNLHCERLGIFFTKHVLFLLQHNQEECICLNKIWILKTFQPPLGFSASFVLFLYVIDFPFPRSFFFLAQLYKWWPSGLWSQMHFTKRAVDYMLGLLGGMADDSRIKYPICRRKLTYERLCSRNLEE